jgi:hypothetical protein
MGGGMRFVILFFILFSGEAFSQECKYGCRPDPMPANCPLAFDGRVYARTYTVSGCHSSIVKSYGEAGTTTCDANPPAGTLLFDFHATEISSNNGSYTVSRIQGGADINLERRVEEQYEGARKAALERGDSKAAAQIEEMKKSHLDIISKYKTNIDTVHVETYASGHGWDLDRKRGWEDVDVTLDVICIEPSNLGEQIKNKVDRDISTAAIVINRRDSDVWLKTAFLTDLNASCKDIAEGVDSLISAEDVDPRRFELKGFGKEGKLCVLLGDEKISSQDFEKACEYKAGETFFLDKSTTYPCFVN